MQTYHERWFRREGRPIGAISPEAAEDRYLAGEPFCLVVHGDPGVLVGFVEVATGFFGVGFLDAYRRIYLEYSFLERDGELFLSQASYFDYEAAGGGSQTNYFFSADGSTTIDRLPLGSSSATTVRTSTNVAGNWELKPSFEGISGLLRTER